MAARIKGKVLDEKMDAIRKEKDLSRKALEKIELLIR